MRSFIYSLPTLIISGENSSGVFEAELLKLKPSKVFIITGKDSAKHNGSLSRISEFLTINKIGIQVCKGCRPNPQSSYINDHAKTLKQYQPDVVIAIGGGSVIDAAKGIVLLSCNDCDDIWNYKYNPSYFSNNSLSLIAVPTTVGTGSEANGSFALYHSQTKEKHVFFNLSVRPKIAWCNPDFTYTIPQKILKQNYIDILSHLLEQYFTLDDSLHWNDFMTLGLIRFMLLNSVDLFDLWDSPNFRAEIHLISLIAMSYMLSQGKAVSWLLHHLSDTIGLHLKLSHGEALSLVLPKWLKYLSQSNLYCHRFNSLNSYINSTTGSTVIDLICRLSESSINNKIFDEFIRLKPFIYKQLGKVYLPLERSGFSLDEIKALL